MPLGIGYLPAVGRRRTGSGPRRPVTGALGPTRPSYAPDTESDQFGTVDIDNCLHAIAQSPALFPIALARWLAGDTDIRLGKALLHQASVTHLDQRFPQLYDLTGVPVADAITTARRLCVLVATPAISLGWTLSMARDFPNRDAVSTQAMATARLPRRSVAGRAWRVFRRPRSRAFRILVRPIETLRRAREVQQILEGLPRLRELDMTADMRSDIPRSAKRTSRDPPPCRGGLGVAGCCTK